MNSLHVHGASGRMGSEVVRLATDAGLSLVDAEQADAWVLAVPRGAVAELVERAGSRTVVDMSGHLKGCGAPYGMVREGRLLSGDFPTSGGHYGNPGCIAGTVISAVLDAGLPRLTAPLHITATVSASAAKRDSTGTMGLGKRSLDHPHVAEIERALGVSVASFTVVVAFGVPRGLVVSVSSEQQVPVANSDREDFDVAQVLGTPRVISRVRSGPSGFTLVAASDNLTFPASHAVSLVSSLGTPSSRGR